jgi:hypothetical protein
MMIADCGLRIADLNATSIYLLTDIILSDPE